MAFVFLISYLYDKNRSFPDIFYFVFVFAMPTDILCPWLHPVDALVSLPIGSTHSAAGSAGPAGLSSWYHVIRLLLHSAHGSLVLRQRRERTKRQRGKMKLRAQVSKSHSSHGQVSV